MFDGALEGVNKGTVQSKGVYRLLGCGQGSKAIGAYPGLQLEVRFFEVCDVRCRWGFAVSPKVLHI